ncbi:MAG: DMT family transporter [Bacteroidales bacterium]
MAARVGVENSEFGVEEDSRVLPYAALAFGLVGLGFSAIFAKWANAPGAVSGFYRMTIASAVMAFPFAMRLRASHRLSARHLGYAVLAGLLFASDLACWNTALLITSAANATLLGNTSPLWVGLGAMLLFRQRLGSRFWLGLSVAMAGVLSVFGRDVMLHPRLGLADLLALGSGFFYGLFFLATERARDGLESLVCWWVSAAASAVTLLGFALILGQPLTGYPPTTYWNLAAVALVTQIGSFLAISYALGHVRASVVAPTLLGQPVLTAVLAVPLLGQHLAASQIAGGIVVIVGILLVHSASRRG